MRPLRKVLRIIVVKGVKCSNTQDIMYHFYLKKNTYHENYLSELNHINNVQKYFYYIAASLKSTLSTSELKPYDDVS